MKKMLSPFCPLLLYPLMLTSPAVFAAHTPGYFDVIAAGSISQVKAGNGRMGITSDETDTLVQTNDNNWNSWGGQLGLGYVYFLGNSQRNSEQLQWFPMFEPELNVYYNRYKNKGNVYRFGSPEFNDLTYSMPFQSTRVMLDGALTIESWRQFSTYVIGGIGNSWNRIGYSDAFKSSDGCSVQNLSLSNKTSSKFVWELGAGIAYAINNTVGLSFQYLYTDYGTLSTTAQGNTGALTLPLLSPARFTLHTQALLLGLHVMV